jgi:serine/threonine protein kinase
MSGGAPPPSLSAGDLLLGRYRIIERITEGGHSVVYRVEDERLRRAACAKVLSLDKIDERVRKVIEQHFVQEVFLMARLPQASTVQIYDFGYLTGEGPGGSDIPFQICEYLAGGPLSRWVKKKERLSIAEALSMALQLCGALAEVHSAGLVHGDVKPQNVLLAETLTRLVAKLADFGIAQLAQKGSSGEGSSVLMYSVNWAAPEQLVGEPLGPSADVYSLALVTIFMLSGRLVFLEPDPTDAYRRRKYAREVVANVLEPMHLPVDAVGLLLDACTFDPRNRVQSALEFGRLLESSLGPMALDGATALPLSRNGERTPVTGETPSDTSLPGRVMAADLWTLSPAKPCPEIAERRLEFVLAEPWCDLTVADNVRVRVTFVPSSSDSPGLHIMGLNCFVSITAGRPSSAVTIDASGCVDFLSTHRVPLARANVTFATAGIERSVVTLAGHSIVVGCDECAGLVAIDFGVGNTCFLGYTAPTRRSP